MSTEQNPPDLNPPAKAGGFSAAHPVAEANPVLVAPTTTGTGKNTIRAPIVAVACWTMTDVRFDFGLSFLNPESKDEIRGLERLRRHHAGSRLTIFGHADPVGTDDENKVLGGRRAMAMFGLLTRRVELWERLNDQPFLSDRWGLTALQRILDALGFPPGPIDGVDGPKTQGAFRGFQAAQGIPATGQGDKTTRNKLFAAYMDLLCGKDFRLGPNDFLAGGLDAEGKGDFQSCGEFNAIVRASKPQLGRFSRRENRQERDDFNSPNRRILILLFRSDTPFPPGKWPCPRALEGAGACRSRFWSDHARRRAAGPEPRLFDETQDTFACRFYHRLAGESPCEFPSRPRRLRIFLHDETGKVMANEPYTLEIDGTVVAKKNTTAEGLVDHEVPAGSARGVLQIQRHTWNLLLEDPPPHSDEDGVRVRLANLGFATQQEALDSDRLEFALWDLQHHAGLEKSGIIDDPTVGFLDKHHQIG